GTVGVDRARAARRLDVGRAAGGAVLGLANEAEQAVIERAAGGRRHELDALAQAHPIHLEGTVVAKGVVAGTAEQRLGRCRAATSADVRVVTLRAVPPQVVRRALTDVGELGGTCPQLGQPMLADVAGAVLGATEARAALDVAVGLD